MITANVKIDLHTHSNGSHDGGIKPAQYHQILSQGLIDHIAITDHNSIEMAQELERELGNKIIIGEEIMTNQGEIIGLFLSQLVQPNQDIQPTVDQIKSQGGVVYVPHPFETLRKGLHPKIIEEVKSMIDIIEVCNGRAFLQNRSEQAVVWSRLNHVPGASSSDAHGYKGLGKTFTVVENAPTAQNLVELLKKGRLITDRPGLRALLYPKYHRLRKRINRHG